MFFHQLLIEPVGVKRIAQRPVGTLLLKSVKGTGRTKALALLHRHKTAADCQGVNASFFKRHPLIHGSPFDKAVIENNVMSEQRKFSTESKKFLKDIHNIRRVFQHIPADAGQLRNPLLQLPVRIQHGVEATGFLSVFHAHCADFDDLVLFEIQAGGF